jgi:hypothetical protein
MKTSARIKGALHAVHHPVLQKLENVSETGSASDLRLGGRDTPNLLGPLEIILDYGQCKTKTIIPRAVHHCQNPSWE